MKTKLASLSTSAGFLEHCNLGFAQGLTCIIGARGTCKSTIVESVRFVFDQNADRVRALTGESESKGEPWHGLIDATLGAGSIRCEIEKTSNDETTTQILEREIGSDTRIFQDGVREHAERDFLHEIEIFSQGDLQRIAEEPHLRLGLIDRHNKKEIKELEEERGKKVRNLSTIGPNLRALRSDIQTLKQELQAAPLVEEQLQEVKKNAPELSPEMETERIRFEHRRRVLDRLSEVDGERKKILAQHTDYGERTESVIELIYSVREESVADPSPVFPALDHLEQALRDLTRAINALAESELEEEIENLENVFEERNTAFYQQRQQEKEINEALKKQQRLEKQREHFERQKKELEAAQEKEDELLEERMQARDAVSVIDDEIYALRIQEIEEINREHGEKVFLSLDTGLGSKDYIQQINDLLTGSRIRYQDEVAADLGTHFAPGALIDIVESGSGQRLAEVLDRDLGQMNRVVAHLSDHPDLYEMEAALPSSELKITFFDEGEPKSVEDLSKGQKATALLPLVLRPLPYPLLIDQPEDDLDNHFIISSLIETIQELKEKRQLIFVTHNANIPVLGDADKVIVMSMRTPTVAERPHTGTVDECKREILDLLEGGADAFMRREEKYGELLYRSAG